MSSAADILTRLDRIMAEITAGTIVPPVNGLEADDLSETNLIDTHAAAARFGYPRDTVALWCRQGCGVKRGGRGWRASRGCSGASGNKTAPPAAFWHARTKFWREITTRS
jgi:hypothetical protein